MFTFQWIIDGSFTDQFLLELNSFPIACNCIPQSHLGFIECFVFFLAVVGLNPANTMCKKSVSSVLRQVWLWEVLTTHSTYLKAICSSGRFVFLVVFIGMLSDTFTDLQHRSYFCRHLPKDILTQACIVLFIFFFSPYLMQMQTHTHEKKTLTQFQDFFQCLVAWAGTCRSPDKRVGISKSPLFAFQRC